MKRGKKKLRAIASTNASNRNHVNLIHDEKRLESTLNFCEELDARKDEVDDNSALFFEGDCFYEAEEDLIERSDEESVGDDIRNCSDEQLLDSWVPFDDVPFDEPPPDQSESGAMKQNQKSLDDAANAVLLEETPLPRMFIPGKVVHIYTHRGAYKAAVVPRAFRELRRISLAGSMLNDHTSKSYYEALLECKSVRRAAKPLPVWTGFGEETTCCCCASRFTWASTSGSEAQEARDRHNCRSCGGLVCDPCSSNRGSVPSIGITLSSRVCDRCYHNMESALNDSRFPIMSVDNEDFTSKVESIIQGDEIVHHQDLPKRNPLVDELAMRMPTSLPECSQNNE